jgi:hypothetical protein
MLRPPPEQVWDKAIDAQDRHEALNGLRVEQKVTIPGNDPFAWAYFSDLHLGGDADYRQMRRDAEIVRDTPRMWGTFHGDATDNWITNVLLRLQREQILTHDESWQLFLSWIDILGEKLKVVISGNHDLWTYILAGVDRIRDALMGCHVLYDKYEVTYDLVLASVSWRIKQRHRWRGTSVFNDTHGIEVGWQRGSCEFDIGIGGHTHKGTLCRPFFRHGQKKFAILTGSYSHSHYGRELGVQDTVSSGCGATIHFPDGKIQFFEDLEVAADFLKFLTRVKKSKI